eukprot:Amastigsp_a175026_173.p1 type:complete len:203 gc:universal Amastigsp_a175026_173:630-22(-)
MTREPPAAVEVLERAATGRGVLDNMGQGSAWIYWTGYLADILPRFRERIGRSGDPAIIPKLFILISLLGRHDARASYSDSRPDSWAKYGIYPVIVTRSGTEDRPLGRHSVYRLGNDDSKHFLVEFAASVRTMGIMRGLSDAELAVQTRAFYYALKEIWSHASTDSEQATIAAESLVIIFGSSEADVFDQLKAVIASEPSRVK